MREMQQADPLRFSSAAIQILGGRGPAASPGIDYLVTLLLASRFLPDALGDPELLRLDEAIAVAKAACRVDPELPVRLAHSLGDRDGTTATDNSRLLAILDAIGSTPGVLLPMISRLSCYSDARVQSKMALMVGRGNHNAQWVAEQLDHPDGRVRANAVEALWGIDSGDARAILRRAAGDPNNRVAGNALLGLYKLGEPETIPRILELARHESEAFRATAAWLTGECEDPRFLALLTETVLAGKGRIRQNAIRSLTRLKLKIARTTAAGKLRVYLTSFRTLADGSRCAGLAVASSAGETTNGILATQIVPWENSRMVTDYRMELRPHFETLTVAFGIPRPAGCGEWAAAATSEVIKCLGLKRKSDLWAVVKYAPSANLSVESDPVHLMADRGLLETAIRHTDRAVAVPSGAFDAISLMMQSLARARGTRRIIFIAGPDVGTGALTMEAYHTLVDRIPREARAADIAIHAILPDRVPALVEDGLRKVCRETSGLCLRADTSGRITEVLDRVYFSCLDRNRLIWRAPDGLNVHSDEPQLRVQVYREEGYGEDSYPPPGKIGPATP